jgi:hypothetical protein
MIERQIGKNIKKVRLVDKDENTKIIFINKVYYYYLVKIISFFNF